MSAEFVFLFFFNFSKVVVAATFRPMVKGAKSGKGKPVGSGWSVIFA